MQIALLILGIYKFVANCIITKGTRERQCNERCLSFSRDKIYKYLLEIRVLACLEDDTNIV